MRQLRYQTVHPSARARLAAALAGFALMSAGGGVAAVVGLTSNGFEVREKAHLSAPATAVYAAVLSPQRWWDSQHTYSGNAANLTLDARAGGCWCEKLADGGTAQHMTVAFLSPGKMVRLRGALGPLQAMGVTGALTFTIKSAPEGGIDLIVDYVVGGYSKGGFNSLSRAVDQVLGDQTSRLQALLDGGAAQTRP